MLSLLEEKESLFFILSFLSIIFIIIYLIYKRYAVKFIWRNKYPSFDDLHALFDRGDIMLSAMVIASTLQLQHPKIAKIIRAHSTYKNDHWRRLIRTLSFIHIIIRANSAQRTKVLSWLQRLHRNIPLYEFQTNVIILATIAYALARCHAVLGGVTEEGIDALVKTIMGMADKLNAKDRGKKAPMTFTEVEAFLHAEVGFDEDLLKKLLVEANESLSTKRQITMRSVMDFVLKPWTTLKMVMLTHYVNEIAGEILISPQKLSPVLFVSRIFQMFWSPLHYSVCPRALTFDGTMDLVVAFDPRVSNILNEVYQEIFGNSPSIAPSYKQDFIDMEAHLPQISTDSPKLPSHSILQDIFEFVRCAYYRGLLESSNGQVPVHLGAIMDGNRRYSRKNNLGTVMEGHRVGAHKLLQFMSWCFSAGINNLTVWALSDDNLKRGKKTLDPLFVMMADYIKEILTGDMPFSISDLRFRVVGDRSILPDYLNKIIDKAEEATQYNTKFNLQLALGYGGRSEVTRAVGLAVKTIACKEGLPIEEAIARLTDHDITRQTYSAQLGLPAIDAILRTSGENRLSGFALWESQAAELAFVNENWPELRQSTFLKAIRDLSVRNRRFGA